MQHPEAHYRRESGAYLIELKLREPRQLFNSFDPSPFPESDLDAEAESYIIDSARDFPLATPLKLVVYLPAAVLDGESARAIPEAVRHYFAYRATVKDRELRHTLRQGRVSLLIGLSFLFFCISTREAIQTNFSGAPAFILQEGLLISGWVAMWRPIQTFLYDWWPIHRMRRVFDKLRILPVEVRVLESADQAAAAPTAPLRQSDRKKTAHAKRELPIP